MGVLWKDISPELPTAKARATSKYEQSLEKILRESVQNEFVRLTPTHKDEYTSFRLKESSEIYVFVVAALISIIFLIQSVIASVDPSYSSTVATLRHIRSCLVPFMGLYIVHVAHNRGLTKLCPNLNPVFISNIIVLTHCITAGLILIFRSIESQCDGKSEIKGSCNPTDDSLPIDALMVCILSSVYAPVVFKCHDPIVTFLGWLWSSISILVAGYLVNVGAAVMISFILFLFMTLITCYEFERYGLHTFFSFMHLEKAISSVLNAEDEKKLLQQQSVDLHSLIGNII
jgi:hypothetical protein